MKKLLSLFLVFSLMGCASIKNEYDGIEGKPNVKQISEDGVMELFESGTGIIVFSFPESEWCQDVMTVLNDKAIEFETTVNYFNIRDIRKSNTDEYQSIYNEIFEYLQTTDFDTLMYEEVWVPTIVKVVNGKVVDFHLGTVSSHVETSEGLPELNSAQLLELKIELDEIFS